MLAMLTCGLIQATVWILDGVIRSLEGPNYLTIFVVPQSLATWVVSLWLWGAADKRIEAILVPERYASTPEVKNTTAECTPREGLKRLPCSRLLGWLRILYSRRTFELVMKPLVDDIQDEWMDLMKANRGLDTWHTRWIELRGYWFVAQALGAQSLVSFAKLVVKLWKGPRP
jgi:hypothetical protein